MAHTVRNQSARVERKHWLRLWMVIQLVPLTWQIACSPTVETVIVGIGPAQTGKDSTCVCLPTPPTQTTGGPGGTTASPPSGTSTAPVAITTVPPNPVDTLAVRPPEFAPNGGIQTFKTLIRLQTDPLPEGAIVEYSTDNGQNWVAGKQFLLNEGGVHLSRIRVGTKTTRLQKTVFTLSFEQIAIIGNSIMEHAPLANVGWFNNNGMAASSPEKDFVHLLKQRFVGVQPRAMVNLIQGGDFERTFWQYDFNKLNDALRAKPDLVIVRIAENVDQNVLVSRNFERYYGALLEHIIQHSATPCRIVCTTSFWNQSGTDSVIRKVAKEKEAALVELCSLVDRPEYMAAQYKDVGVAMHPNDAGMAEIARLIWETIQ